MTETATAQKPTEASATPETSATLLATADSGADKAQQTQTVQAQEPAGTEKPAASTQQTVPIPASATPEKYTFTAPEGTAYDPDVLEAYSAAAKEANLSQDAAQKVIEKMAPAIVARQVDQIRAIHTEWQTASTADAEFGGEKLTENLGVARKALESFGTPELRTLLDETGLGNHPEVIRFMYRAGKAISVEKFVGGQPKGTGVVNKAAILYDKT